MKDNIKILLAEKHELQRKFDYYNDMKSFYNGSIDGILETVRLQINRKDEQISKARKSCAAG